MTGIVHAMPSDSEVVTPCCGKTLFELPITDRVAVAAEAVTCGQAAPSTHPHVAQLAMFMQRRDAVQHGVVRDGTAHPTWDELGPVGGQSEYLTESAAFIAAMLTLGWKAP